MSYDHIFIILLIFLVCFCSIREAISIFVDPHFRFLRNIVHTVNMVGVLLMFRVGLMQLVHQQNVQQL